MDSLRNSDGSYPVEKLEELGLQEGGRVVLPREQAIIDLGEIFGLSDREVEEKFRGLFRPEIIQQGDPISLRMEKTDGMCTTLFVQNMPSYRRDNPEPVRFLYTVTLEGPKSPADDNPVETWDHEEERKVA